MFLQFFRNNYNKDFLRALKTSAILLDFLLLNALCFLCFNKIFKNFSFNCVGLPTLDLVPLVFSGLKFIVLGLQQCSLPKLVGLGFSDSTLILLGLLVLFAFRAFWLVVTLVHSAIFIISLKKSCFFPNWKNNDDKLGWQRPPCSGVQEI